MLFWLRLCMEVKIEVYILEMQNFLVKTINILLIHWFTSFIKNTQRIDLGITKVIPSNSNVHSEAQGQKVVFIILLNFTQCTSLFSGAKITFWLQGLLEQHVHRSIDAFKISLTQISRLNIASLSLMTWF